MHDFVHEEERAVGQIDLLWRARASKKRGEKYRQLLGWTAVQNCRKSGEDVSTIERNEMTPITVLLALPNHIHLHPAPTFPVPHHLIASLTSERRKPSARRRTSCILQAQSSCSRIRRFIGCALALLHDARGVRQSCRELQVSVVPCYRADQLDKKLFGRRPQTQV